MRTILYMRIPIICLLLASSAFAAPEVAPDKPAQFAISGQSTGPSIDRGGNPVIDPTNDVLRLVEAAAKRQDDLLQAAKELTAEKVAHQNELAELRSSHSKELREADAGRSDMVRQVDREDVNKTAAAAQTAIATLAKQTTDLATTLQKTLADTAIAVESRQSSFSTEVNKRLSALELSSSERSGRSTVSDPQLLELLSEVRILGQRNASGVGRSTGLADSAGWIVSGLMALLAVAGYLKNGKNKEELERRRKETA